jgi:hypothetical protein
LPLTAADVRVAVLMVKAKPELAWGWPEIAVVMIWKIAPNGFVILKEDMISLPTDRVLREYRDSEKIVLSFIGVKHAKRLSAAELGEHRATVSELQGRWQKIAVVAAWHFARLHKLGKNDSITLTEYDRAAVPGHLQLMASGHAQGVEWRFLPLREAKAIQDWDRDNEGILIKEKTQL